MDDKWTPNYKWILEYVDHSELNGESIVEVGSRDALDAIWFSELFQTKVIAFEASPQQILECQNNIFNSSVSNSVTLVPWALNDQDEDLTFWEVDLAAYPNAGVGSLFEIDFTNRVTTDEDRNKAPVQKPVIVKSVRWDSLGLDAPKLLAMDVQGAEQKVLSGFGNSLHSIKYITLESEPVPSYSGGTSTREVDQYLRKMGFRLLATREIGRGSYKLNRHLVRKTISTMFSEKTFKPSKYWQGQYDLLYVNKSVSS